MQRLRMLVVLAIGLLPASTAKNRLLRACGFEIHPTARISPVVLQNVAVMRCAAGVVVQAGSWYKGLTRIDLGEGVIVGRWNTFTASPIYRVPGGAREPEHVGALVMGAYAYITNRHYFDCSGGVLMADWAAFGGLHTVVLSHTLELEKLVSRCEPVRLGDHSFIGSCCTVAAGAVLPDRCVVAMGSVVRPGLTSEETLYGGVPARVVRSGIAHWEWFRRPPYTGVEEGRLNDAVAAVEAAQTR